ncbi:MAG: hypothetical protein AMXMBFR84_31940 [Candidatus Hydrogenedentota bacterium]
MGKPLPELTLGTWYGAEQHPNRMAGSIIVICVFAAWCKHCIRDIPENNDLVEAYRHLGVTFVGVCNETDADELPDNLKFRPANYSIAVDVGEKSLQALKVRNFPEYYLVDRQQIVRAAGVTLQDVEGHLEMVLAEEGQD